VQRQRRDAADEIAFVEADQLGASLRQKRDIGSAIAAEGKARASTTAGRAASLFTSGVTQ
jgi:hypothetical protein